MACQSERSIAIGDLVTGNLPADAAPELLDHIETCPECSEELDLAAAMVGAAERRGDAAFALSPRRRWTLLLVAAAAVLVVGFIAWNRIDAALGRRALVELASLEPIAVSDVHLRGPDGGPDAERYVQAMERYAAGDYAAAEAGLAALLAEKPESPLVALYLGSARLMGGDLEGAVAPLEAAAEHGEGLVQERALWYLASARLAQADGAAARPILERLVAIGGDYEPNARAKLSAVRDALE